MDAKQTIDLDMPLVSFGPNAQWRLRSACEGCLIVGGIGSGKTTGSYSFILRKLLSAGFGGLLLTVKPQEADEYRKLCIEAGREKDLIVIEPSGQHGFNWLEYVSRNSFDDLPLTGNILEVLKTCIKAGAEKEIGHGDDGFWQQSLDLMIGHVIDLCILAYGFVSVEKLYHIVQSLPKFEVAKPDNSNAELNAFERAWENAKQNVNDKRHQWHISLDDTTREGRFTKLEYETMLHEAVPEARLLDFLAEFFFSSFKYLSPKTRSIIEFTFSGFLYSLLRDPVYSLFCKKSSVSPEDCFSGKIIMINLPVKKYNEVGRNVQLMVKYVFQRAWEKRTITDESMPVFLAADEAYTFVHEHDTLFQATARSARVCCLYVTQNLSNYHAAMGGEKAKYRVNSLISTLATKIFHANTDAESNGFASSLIGEKYRFDPSISTSMSSDNFTHGEGLGLKLEPIYRPEFFVSLKCGGPMNDFNVEAVIHKQGDPIVPGKNYALVNFKQQIN